MNGTDDQQHDADGAGGGTPAAAPAAARRQLVAAAIYAPGKSRRDLHIPEGAGYAEAAAGEDTGTYVYIDPAGRGPTNTITRAESAGILAALQYGSDVATDSAAVMYQLRNMIMRPMTMQRHRNKRMLEAIIEAAMQRDGPVHIYKVKAHTGVHGNEHADEAAKRAAQLLGEGGGGNGRLLTCQVTPDPPCSQLLWPVHTRDSDANNGSEQSAPDWVATLSAPLKTALHGKHRLGHSNVDSLYYRLWEQVVPLADGKISNAYLGDATIKPLARRYTFQARCGELNTANARAKWRLVQCDKCLLCGEPDGAHHSLSGCSHMKGMYIDRHNEAGRLILKALKKGALGGSLVMHDVGHQVDAELLGDDSTAAGIGTRIPEWVCTPPVGQPPDMTAWRRCRPDILIAVRGRGDRDTLDEFASRQLHILEIKYCRDTDNTPQTQRAEDQHRQLRESLLGIGYTEDQVQLHTITLGVTGTIYKDTQPALRRLGIGTQDSKRTCRKLHTHAVHSVMAIMQTKWSQEAARAAAPSGQRAG